MPMDNIKNIFSDVLDKVNNLKNKIFSSNAECDQVISIDTEHSAIHFYTRPEGDSAKIEHKVRGYAGKAFDVNFYASFKQALVDFFSDIPSESVRKISLILPDNAAALDIVNVPTMKGAGAIKNALNLSLGSIYSNYNDLSVQSFQAASNKQYTTFNTVATQKSILTELYVACSENKLFVDTATFAYASTVSAAIAFEPKLKNTSFLFLDIKDTYSRFVFVVNGRAVGYFPLPFGLEFLSRPRLVSEDMLFDHSMAELTVLNAQEKAKARKLSVMAESVRNPEITGDASAVIDASEDVESLLESEESSSTPLTTANADSSKLESMTDDDELDEDEVEDDSNEPATEELFAMTSGNKIEMPKYMAKKTPRKLPKFMQRPIPETEQGIICENFRVFVKWALTLIAGNEKIVNLAPPEFVLVNIPSNISYVIDNANEEKETNKIEFRALTTESAAPIVLSNLELYGGFFPNNIHTLTKM